MKSLKSDFCEVLSAALNRRAHLSSRFDLVRLCDGAGDRLPGLYIDKLGPVILVHAHAGAAGGDSALANRAELDRTLRSSLSPRCVYMRVHQKKANVRGERSEPAVAELLSGEPVPSVTVEEQGLRLLLKPEAAVNAGVFLDARKVRKWLLEHSRGKRVLNTFCYTGSLGLAAFCGGATEVVQLDCSKAVLSWAKENLELNRTDSCVGTMRFIADDCISFMKKELRRIERGAQPYDIVILDPPSFGTGQGKSFSLQRNLEDLVQLGLKLLAARGTLSLTCNQRSLEVAQLRGVVHQASKSQGRLLVKTENLSPPSDDFADLGPESISLRGILCELAPHN